MASRAKELSDLGNSGHLNVHDDGTVTLEGGNIGIGTTSPDAILDVRGGAASRPTFIHASGYGGIQIAGTGASSGGALIFSNDYTNGVVEEYSIHLDGATDDLVFISGDPADIATQERMRLTDDGKLGIGTTSPSNLLTVDVNSATSTNDSISIRNRGITALAQAVGLRFQYNTAIPSAIRTTVTNLSSGAGRLGLFTSPDATAGNLSERLTIASDGKVGIGTTGPTRLLSVSSATTRTTGFEDITEFLTPSIGAGGSVSLNIGKANSTKNLGKMAFHYAGDGSNSNYLGFGFYDADNLMVVKADGKVGIGTTSPARPLHVQGEIYVNHNADNAGVKTSFRALHTSNNTIEIHQFGQSHSNGAVNQIGVSNAEQHLHLVTDSSANVDAGTSTKGIFLRSGGNVGIGIKSPNSVTNYKTLHIDGTVGSLIDMGASNLESRIVADTNGLGFQVTPGSHTHQNIRWKAGQISGAVDSHMILLANGNVGIGTDNPGTTMHLYNGTQARFAMQNPSRRFDLTADGDGFTIRDQSAAVNRFRIDTNGYAVLGSGSPTSSYGLEIQKSNAGAALYLHNKDVPGVTGSSVYHAYQVTQTNGQSARLAEITATGTSAWGGELTFATKPANGAPNNSATVRMKIEAGGNVGIGTTDPGTLLDVNGSSGGNGAPHNSGISVRSGFVAFRNNGTTFHEVIQGESNCMGIYNYNYNDGVLIYTNNADSNATPSFHPAYHFGGYNNADTETFGAGWANGDPIFTMARPSTKNTSQPSRGLSNSSNFTSIVKTATRTEFRDNQGQHYFHSTVVANNHLSAEADPGFWYRKNAGANAGNTRRAVVLNDGQLIFRAYTDYNHKMWYADGINLGTNQSHGHFRVFGENNTSRGATDQGQTHRFSVDTTSGNVGVSEGGTQIYNNSDERLKTNIVDLPDGALTKVNALRPVTYDWRYKTQNDKPYGFIAQEVQAVDNELVFTNGPTMYREDKTYGEGLEPDGTIEDTLGINERKLLPIYAKAIQELSDLVEQLQARIDSAGIE